MFDHRGEATGTVVDRLRDVGLRFPPCARGEPLGRPRVKLVTWSELLDAADAVAAGA